jgi:tryptophan synthase alpha chain
MNRIKELFQRKHSNVLNIYFTAGYPHLQDTGLIIKALDAAGVDLIEVGIPYSDPLADGTTIQESGTQALKNGMNLPLLFDQIEAVRDSVHCPLILMGYFNQIMQFGEQSFLERCKEVGIDGIILPDLPLLVYQEEYQTLFEEYELPVSFLITPQTSEERVIQIDALSKSFIYMVSNASITGAKSGISAAQIDYFDRINALKLNNPRLIGFGISSPETFSTACQYANGAIIGSAFIQHLKNTNQPIEKAVQEFVSYIKGV